MSNLTQELEALGIKELEARQEALREELRQIQQQIDLELQSNSKIDEVVAVLKRVQQWMEQFRPSAKERLQDAVLNCLYEYMPLPTNQWSADADKQAVRISSSSTLKEETITAADAILAPEVATRTENTAAKEVDKAAEEYLSDTAESEAELNKTEGRSLPAEVVPSPVSLPFAEFILLNPKVGYQRRISNGEILCAYLGGKNKSLLEVWGRYVAQEFVQNGGTCRQKLRPAERLKDCKYELKISPLSFAALEELTKIDTSKSPKFRATASCVEEHLREGKLPEPLLEEEEKQQTAPVPTSLVLQVGDRVLVESDRHGSEFVNQVGIVSAPSKVGAVLNVKGQLKYFHLEELNIVEQSFEARKPADDLAVSRSTPLNLTDDAVPW